MRFCLRSDMRSVHCLTFSADNAASFVPYYLAVSQLPNPVGSVCPKGPRLLCSSCGLFAGIPRASFPISPLLPPYPSSSVRLDSSLVSSRVKLNATDWLRLPLTGRSVPAKATCHPPHHHHQGAIVLDASPGPTPSQLLRTGKWLHVSESQFLHL